MLLVGVETIERTAISCFFYLTAAGWGVMWVDYDPFMSASGAKFLGVAYICHSAYFITVGN